MQGLSELASESVILSWSLPSSSDILACSQAKAVMAPIEDFRSIDEIRRKVISELVDLEIVLARRRLTRRQRVTRRLRRRLRRVGGFGR